MSSPQRVAAAAQAVLGDRPAIALAREASGVDPNRLPAVLKSAQTWNERLRSDAAVMLRAENRSAEPLAGKLFDESGEPLYVQGAAKGQRRYRY
jgi:hypothetical protein